MFIYEISKSSNGIRVNRIVIDRSIDDLFDLFVYLCHERYFLGSLAGDRTPKGMKETYF